jgi:hypothetical protein
MPDTVTATAADAAAWTAILGLAARFGPDRAAAAALFASGHPVWPYLLLAAARNTAVGDVLAVLHLAPGQLADVVNVAIPPPSPLPPDEATTFPPDDDGDPDEAPGPFAARMRLVLLRELPEPTAAALASLVPGRVGVILFMIARGDARHDVADTLRIGVDEVDTVLDHAAGHHVVRPG